MVSVMQRVGVLVYSCFLNITINTSRLPPFHSQKLSCFRKEITMSPPTEDLTMTSPLASSGWDRWTLIGSNGWDRSYLIYYAGKRKTRLRGMFEKQFARSWVLGHPQELEGDSGNDHESGKVRSTPKFLLLGWAQVALRLWCLWTERAAPLLRETEKHAVFWAPPWSSVKGWANMVMAFWPVLGRNVQAGLMTSWESKEAWCHLRAWQLLFPCGSAAWVLNTGPGSSFSLLVLLLTI